MVTPRDRYRVLDDDAPSDLLDLVRPSWMATAACRGTSVDFFAERDAGQVAAALQLCGNCDVFLRCRSYALADPSLVGVWGGLTTAARRQLHRLNAKRKDTPRAQT